MVAPSDFPVDEPMLLYRLNRTDQAFEVAPLGK